MRILGISSGFHDAAATVIVDGEIVFAGHSERYSKEKNDPFINPALIHDALAYGQGIPDVIVLHENAYAKKLRQLLSGQFNELLYPTQKQWIKKYHLELCGIPIKSYWHHETHAAAGVFTSEFDECAVMVVDAIGEFDTASIWYWDGKSLTKKHSIQYPNSLGLFYTAMTQRVGLIPMEDEYILMGMAAYGNRDDAILLSQTMAEDYFKYVNPLDNCRKAILMKQNVHKGVGEVYSDYNDFVIARATQKQLEHRLQAYALYAKQITGSANLVFMGGVALNCVANTKIRSLFDDMHIMPNPGDAGSSLGAAALEYFNQTKEKVKWRGPYLGRNIVGPYPVQKALASLEKNEIFGIANGRAEFGPRALGNRSLFADPRGPDIKHAVNAIKQRQQFRPFAPVILEEHAHDYFKLPKGKFSPYMSYAVECKCPREFPAIVHVDNTSRVQTVNKEQHPGLYTLLSEFYKKTGCPMLLNTSLNIKGQPIVNDYYDAERFQNRYNIPVYTSD